MNAFGLYRNNCRSLLGIYFIFAGLTFQERKRRSNFFTCHEILGGYGAYSNEIEECDKAKRHLRCCLTDMRSEDFGRILERLAVSKACPARVT